MAARIRLWVFSVLLFVLLVACQGQPPAPPSGPPSQVTVDPYVGQEDFIVIGIDSITPLRSGESGPNEQTELRFVMIGTDAQGNTDGLFCPNSEPVTLAAGDEVVNPCGSVLAFDEATAGEQFDLLFIGVDEDDISFVEDMGAQAGIALLAKGVAKALKAIGHIGSAAGGPVAVAGEFALETAISYAGSKAADYFQQEDIIGQHLLTIYRRSDWGAGEQVTFLTQDGGMRIKYHVVRASVGDGAKPVGVVPDEDAQLQLISAQAPARPTPVPPTSTPALPPPPARLILTDASGRDITTLRDGDTIDLNRLGRYLDVRAETNGLVGSVVFLLDDLSFCSNDRDRCVENSPPYIMNGDLSGDLYGNWDWATLTGGAHTISAYACDLANGAPPCSEWLSVRVTVQR